MADINLFGNGIGEYDSDSELITQCSSNEIGRNRPVEDRVLSNDRYPLCVRKNSIGEIALKRFG